MRFLAVLALALAPSIAFADTFEIQGAYRASEHVEFKGSEFTIHYLGEDWNDLSFGAYFASSFWHVPHDKKGQTLEGGPEVRWEKSLANNSYFLGLQYALFSSGKVALPTNDIGARITGPRFSGGFVFPFESGYILSIGLSKGFEKIAFHGDVHDTEAFESYSVFLGLTL